MVSCFLGFSNKALLFGPKENLQSEHINQMSVIKANVVMNMVFYLSFTRSTDQSNSEILFTLKLIELHRGPLEQWTQGGLL